jgi:hypothetical protein
MKDKMGRVEVRASQAYSFEISPENSVYWLARSLVADAQPENGSTVSQRLQECTGEAVPASSGSLPVAIYVSSRRESQKLGNIRSQLSSRFEILPFPMVCANTRHLSRWVNHLLYARPELLILGDGMDDFVNGKGTSQPRVSIDEFRFRLEWLLGKFQQSQLRVAWVFPEESRPWWRFWRHKPMTSATSGDYVDIIRELAAQYDVTILDGSESL